MKITAFRTIHTYDGSRNAIFLHIETDEGLTGLGEAYSIGPDRAVIAAIGEMEQWFVGQDPGRIEWLLRRAKSNMRFPLGQVAWSAISAIDLALWDIAGKAAGEPVYKLLGGPTRDRVRVYHGIYGDSPEKVGEHALSLMEEGYTAFKTSPLPSDWRKRPWRETVRSAEARMRGIRDAIGPGPDLAVDVHTAVREPWKAKELAQAIAPFRLMFIEEPARPDFTESTAELRRSFRTALATGENLYGIARYAELLDANAVDIIQPDLLCCGGFLEAKKIAALAEAQYVTVAPHNPLGLLSTAAGVHIAAAINNFVILEYHGDHAREKARLIDDMWAPVNGHFELPTRPGIGMELNMDEVRSREPVHWDRGFPTAGDSSPGYI
jgi:galactonate dehydratase